MKYEYPRDMIKCLLQEGYQVKEVSPGIFYITGRIIFRTQLIVGNRLPQDEHIWLTALTKDISKKRYTDFLNKTASMMKKREKECAEAVLDIIKK